MQVELHKKQHIATPGKNQENKKYWQLQLTTYSTIFMTQALMCRGLGDCLKPPFTFVVNVPVFR